MLKKLRLLKINAGLVMGLTTSLGCGQMDAADQMADIPPNVAEPGQELAPVSGGNLSPESRISLEARGQPLLERLLAARAHRLSVGTQQSRKKPDDPAGQLGSQSEQHATEGDAPIASADPSEAAEPDIQQLWSRFLDSVFESPAGGFAIDDMFFQNEDDLLAVFEASYTGRVDKGLVVPANAWPREGCSPFCLDPPNLTVCWTPNSTATAAEKARVVSLIQASWGRLSDTVFDFGTAPGFRTCAETCVGSPCVLTAGPGQDIRIFQAASVPNGCSANGKLSATTTSLQCPGGPLLHPYASMYLTTSGSPNATALYVDYTAVHEFGHAIGLLHEQDRTDYFTAGNTCASGTAGRNAAGTPGQDQSFSTFDNNSIMNYCQQELVLMGGKTFVDPRAAELSVGDIFSSRRLYQEQQYEAVFRYSSWSNAQVSLGLTLLSQGTVPFTVSATRTPQNLSTGRFGLVGDGYTVSASTTNPRLKCSAGRQNAIAIFGGPYIVPPLGFTTQPIQTTCYDVAGLADVVSSVL